MNLNVGDGNEGKGRVYMVGKESKENYVTGKGKV